MTARPAAGIPVALRSPAANAALIESWSLPGFEVVAATARGLVRAENQDAYAVSPGPPLRVAVFDGVGGQRHGGEAARAAATRVPCGAGEDLLAEMEAAVAASGGATTAVIAELLADAAAASVTWVGDSLAYRLTGEAAQPLGAPHCTADGRLTRALGVGGSGESLTTRFDVPLLLCSDGVPRRAIPAAPRTEDDLVKWAGRLVERVHQLGAPDNLTFVVVRRQPLS